MKLILIHIKILIYYEYWMKNISKQTFFVKLWKNDLKYKYVFNHGSISFPIFGF